MQKRKRTVNGDATNHYFKEAGAIPLLSHPEEIALAKIIEKGLHAQRKLTELEGQGDQALLAAKQPALLEKVRAGIGAQQQLMTTNLRLVIYIAKKMHTNNAAVTFGDLIQEGNIGLAKAALHFDWRRKKRFSTYATWWIREAIFSALRKARIVHIPAYIIPLLKKYKQARHVLNRPLSAKEFAKKMKISQRQAEYVLTAYQLQNCVCWNDCPKNTDKETVSADSRLEEEENKTAMRLIIHEALDQLSPTEREVVNMRFALNNQGESTLNECGLKLGKTKEGIRLIQNRALKALGGNPRLQELVQ